MLILCTVPIDLDLISPKVNYNFLNDSFSIYYKKIRGARGRGGYKWTLIYKNTKYIMYKAELTNVSSNAFF